MAFTNTSDTLGTQETLDALVANTLTELNQDDVTYLGNYALYGKTALTSVNFPNVVTTSNQNTYAFQGCTGLVSAALDKLTTIASYMFNGCKALTTLSLAAATQIDSYAFQNCSSLVTVNLPNVKTLGNYCFSGCSKLKNLTLGAITSINQRAFENCSALTSFDFSAITTLHMYAFNGSGLTEVVLAKETSLPTYVFGACKRLGLVDIASTSTKPTISANAFNGSGLSHLIIRYTGGAATLSNVSAFTGTPIARGFGAIYVPSALVDTYKAASNWSTYASQIYAIDDYPVSLGTITDTWAEVFEAEEDGTYSTKYSVGDTKTVDVGGVNVLMEIAGFDEDTSKITWLCKYLYATHNMNSAEVTTGGWAATAMRDYLISDILPYIEETVKNHIIAVDKTYYDNSSSSTLISTDSIWIPSTREVCFTGVSLKETSGIQYSELFSDKASRIKRDLTNTASYWWLRSAYSSANFYIVSSSGTSGTSFASSSYGVVFGFCT